MAAKVVKTLTISGISGGTYPIMGGNLDSGEKAPGINCSTFADARKAFVPDPQPELSPLKIRVADDGQSARPTTGTTGNITITATYTDASTKATTIGGFIESCEPSMVEVNGERVPAWDIDFRPTGGGALPTTTTSGT